MPNTKDLEVVVTLSVDAHLSYLIQNITKQPTSDILGYLRDLATKIVDIGNKNREKTRTNGIRKSLTILYPGTEIPIAILVEGEERQMWFANNNIEQKLKFHCRADVGFPSKPTYVDSEILDSIIAEKALLGGCDMPLFEKPKLKIPTLYKKLISEFTADIGQPHNKV